VVINDYMAYNKMSPVIFTGVILAKLPEGVIQVAPKKVIPAVIC